MPDEWDGPPEDSKLSDEKKLDFLVGQKLLNHQADQRVRAILRGELPLALERWLSEADLEALPDPGWLVEGLLPDVGLALLVGQPGSMKSLLALGVAAAVVSGTPFLGREVVAGPVVFVAAEGLRGTKKRWKAQRRRMWQDGAAVKHRIAFDTSLDLLDDETVKDFAEAVAEVGARYVVVDTLARCAVGANENSAQDMGVVVRNLDRIVQAANCCVVLVHHASKGRDGDAVRGSSALRGAADAVLHAEVKGAGLVVVHNIKQKDDEPAADFHAGFAAVEGTGSGVLDVPNLAQLAALAAHDQVHRVDLVLDKIKSTRGLRQKALIDALGLPPATVKREVKRLISAGLVAEKRLDRAVFYEAVEAKS